MRIAQTILAIVLVAVAAIVPLVVIWRSLKKVRASGRRVQFSLAELIVFVLILTPCLALVGRFPQLWPSLLVLCAFIAVAALAGFLKAHAKEARSTSKAAVSMIVTVLLTLMVLSAAAVSMPALWESRMSGHSVAVGALKAYGGAQAIYRRRNGVYADDFRKLESEYPANPLLDKVIVSADGPYAPPHAGYYYVDLSEELNHEFEYAIVSHPQKYDSSGVMSFYTDQSYNIWQKDMEGKTLTQPMRDPSAEGWQLIGN